MAQLSQSVQDCIDACRDCQIVCMETLTYCMEKGGKHAEPSHLGLMMDCAAICQVSANLMLRGSDFQMDMCQTCAEVCQRCADDCRRMGDDEKMKRCADICEKCSQTCRKMSAKAAA